MNPINQAAVLMGKRRIVRQATAKANGTTVFLWELDDGVTFELVLARGKGGFKSVRERTEGFDKLVEFYRHSNARVFSREYISPITNVA